MMDKHGIKSLDQLSSEEKKRFFNAVDKNYKAKNEETLNENPAVIATANVRKDDRTKLAPDNAHGNLQKAIQRYAKLVFFYTFRF